jgi:hypothetical protein
VGDVDTWMICLPTPGWLRLHQRDRYGLNYYTDGAVQPKRIGPTTRHAAMGPKDEKVTRFGILSLRECLLGLISFLHVDGKLRGGAGCLNNA